jgi:hypothetical protein
MPVILAIQEAQIRRIAVTSQFRQIVHEKKPWVHKKKKKKKKKRLVVWLKV